MSLPRYLIAVMVLCALSASCCWGQADRPRKKMIEAITAIDVSAGVERIERKASLPWMISQVLVYKGIKTNYAEFCAVSGWSAEFQYDFDKAWISFLTLDNLPSGRCFSRGIRNYGKRLSTFSWPEVETENDRLLASRAAWEFTIANIAAGNPVLCDYMDGGVFYGYDETQEDPVLLFSTNGPGFGALHRSRFTEAYGDDLRALGVIQDVEEAVETRTLFIGTVLNLLVKAYEKTSEDAPSGIAGMQALALDLLDENRDWAADDDWLRWPLGEQTEARLCTAVYLRRNSKLMGDQAEPYLLAAADHYDEAFNWWQGRLQATWFTDGKAGEPAEPGRREAIAGHVYKALGAELLALNEIQKAVKAAEDAQTEEPAE